MSSKSFEPPNEQQVLSVLDIELPNQFDNLNTYAVGGIARLLARYLEEKDRLPTPDELAEECSDVDLMIQGASVKDLVERDFKLVVSGQSPPDLTATEFHNKAVEAALDDQFFEFISQVEGNQFPVFIDELGREVALARTERSTGSGHANFEWDATPDVTIDEDAKRRDFTVNAMMVDLTTGDFIDPFGGRKDIQRELIRCVSDDSFRDDPLRILRMARFAARLDFDVEPKTLDAASQHVDGLRDLPAERWGMEVVKAMKQAEQPSRFFRILATIGALDLIFPELAALKGVPAGPEEYHKEGDSFEHTMMVLDEMAALRPGEPRAMFAAVAHDLGKGLTPGENPTSHPKHHVRGVELMDDIQQRLVLSRELRGVMKTASRFHMRMHNLDELRESTILSMVDRLRDDYEVDNPGDVPVVEHIKLDELIDLGLADSRGRIPSKDIDVDAARDLFDRALMVLDTIDGAFIMDRFDPKNGEHIGELLQQERILALRNSDEYNLTMNKL